MLYCLMERSPSEQPQEDQQSEHRRLHLQVEKHQCFQSLLLIFVKMEFIIGPDLLTNVTGAECVQCSNVRYNFCFQRERNCFKQFHH